MKLYQLSLGIALVSTFALGAPNVGAQENLTPPKMQPQTFNSFHPGELWPDTNGVPINAHGGGILHHNGVYYWFGEHKTEGDAGNIAQVGVHVYSSRDLYNWKDEGVALSVIEDDASEIAKGSIIERPKVVYNAKTGKFVMWFHLELKGQGYSAARAGMAVADNVTGPFTYVRSYRPNKGIWPIDITEELKVTPNPEPELSGPAVAVSGRYLRRDFERGQMSRDMTIFMDDDQKAYLVTSAEENFTMHIHELTDDYQDFTGKWARLHPGGWNEAPTIFKRGAKYYSIMSGNSGWAPNRARSYSSDSIWGPWQSLGDPSRGTPEQTGITFESQSTHVLPVAGLKDAFIFMGDRWRPKNAIDGRYVWLPIEWEDEKPVIRWHDQWDLSFFTKEDKAQ